MIFDAMNSYPDLSGIHGNCTEIPMDVRKLRVTL